MSIMDILERFVDDWSEIYANGELVWEGPKDVYDYQLVTAFLEYFTGKLSTTLRRRRIVVEYKGSDPDKIPVHRITGENYFNSDWKNAEPLERIYE